MPTALRRARGNPGKRRYNPDEPVPPEAVPRCPGHLSPPARAEWRRLVRVLARMGVVTAVDRAVLAAYCQAWGRWVEAEEKLKVTPVMLKTPSGHVQQSPWLSVANRQMELMGRCAAELGITPASRSRVAAFSSLPGASSFEVRFVTVYDDGNGGILAPPGEAVAPTAPVAGLIDVTPARPPGDPD
jgi:P27 family predicted phage terminase small subunit